LATITLPSEPPTTEFERQQLEFDRAILAAVQAVGSR
jgi:hypothetical protein